jgi:hypothetical protein
MKHRNVPGGVMWLRDLLPESVENARIILYGYNSSTLGNASIGGIREHARLSVETLQAFKRGDKVSYSVSDMFPSNC